jgi:hypothetical protein
MSAISVVIAILAFTSLSNLLVLNNNAEVPPCSVPWQDGNGHSPNHDQEILLPAVTDWKENHHHQNFHPRMGRVLRCYSSQLAQHHVIMHKVMVCLSGLGPNLTYCAPILYFQSMLHITYFLFVQLQRIVLQFLNSEGCMASLCRSVHCGSVCN